MTKQGLAAIVETKGNPHTHLILRGGGGRSNFDAESVAAAVRALSAASVNEGLMVDCSHANSGKDPAKQPLTAEQLALQIEAGNRHIIGIMLESFLLAGSQPVGPKETLVYGQSITDGCMSWDSTVGVLDRLAQAARSRR